MAPVLLGSMGCGLNQAWAGPFCRLSAGLGSHEFDGWTAGAFYRVSLVTLSCRVRLLPSGNVFGMRLFWYATRLTGGCTWQSSIQTFSSIVEPVVAACSLIRIQHYNITRWKAQLTTHFLKNILTFTKTASFFLPPALLFLALALYHPVACILSATVIHAAIFRNKAYACYFFWAWN